MRILVLVCVGLGVLTLSAGVAAAPSDLPSPDAMVLGGRVAPRAVVIGFRRGIEKEALEPLGGPALTDADRRRASAAMAPLLDEAFPPELLAGIGAQFLAGRYDGGELRELRRIEESPLGKKLRELDARLAEIPGDPAEVGKAREQLALQVLTASERQDAQALAATPLGRKQAALAPDLMAAFLDGLDRHYRSIRGGLEPRLRAAAERALAPAHR